MKLLIISDLHFGDKSCLLVTRPGPGKFIEGPRYQEFKEAAGEGNDYLVLAGDVFDFSIANYATAYKYGKVFFQHLKEDGIAKEIIYLAGNHDADIWHTVQHQRSVINKISNGELPERFQHSVAGIIDDRKTTPPDKRGLSLDRVTIQETEGEPRYGGLFLDKITGEATPTTFNFAYPNLYVVTDEETVLVTHGQYLEPFWAFLGELALALAYDDLGVEKVDVEETVEMNFPFSQLSCTGIGQAGVLTKLVRRVQADVKNGNLKRLERYFDRLTDELFERAHLKCLKRLNDLAGGDLLTGPVKKEVMKMIGESEQTRYSKEFAEREEVRERFKRFYESSLLEIKDISRRTGRKIPAPRRIIFGHTHQPIPWKHPMRLASQTSGLGKDLLMSNGGGWIVENNKFCGAEIFTYETKVGFKSVPIR